MKVKIFVAYSHKNKKYLTESSLLGHLKGLEHDNIAEFWYDERITTGDIWDDEIKQNISESHIALVLVSELFLNSPYVRTEEIPAFLHKRREEGMVIFPVILSACDWKIYPWLSVTQFLPKDGKNIERNYNKQGQKQEIFLEIKRDLRRQIEAIQKKISNPGHSGGTAGSILANKGRKVMPGEAVRTPTDTKQTTEWENPFELVTGNDLRYEDMPHLFVGDYTDFNTIEKRFDTILEGQRGTGKTMILRYMACETQLAVWTDEKKRDPKDFFRDSRRYIGIYCRLEQGVFDRSDLEAVESDDRRGLLFEHRLSLVCLSHILKTLGCIMPNVRIDASILRNLKRRLSMLLDEKGAESCQDWGDICSYTLDTIDICLHQVDTHLGSLLPGGSPTTFNPNLTLAGQVIPFLEFLQAQLGLKCPFFLMLDDFDVLRPSQQSIVFRTASARKLSIVCFKYGIMTLGKKSILSGTDRTYREGHDYDLVLLDWTDNGLQSNYRKAVEKITEKRLEVKAWPAGAKFSTMLSRWEHGEKLRRQLREQTQTEYQELPVANRPRTFDSYWSKYGNARYFQYLAKKGIHHNYAGYETAIDVSSGIYRQYLEICGQIVARALSSGWRPDSGQSIGAGTQDKAIRDYSHAMMHSLSATAGDTTALLSGNIQITSMQMVTFIQSIAELFRRRMLSAIREPEIFSIAIRDSLEGHEMAKAILDVASRESILQRRSTDYSSKTGGGERLPTYMLNRRLAPWWGLGLRMQGRIELLADDVVLAAMDSRAFLEKFMKPVERKDKERSHSQMDFLPRVTSDD